MGTSLIPTIMKAVAPCGVLCAGADASVDVSKLHNIKLLAIADTRTHIYHNVLICMQATVITG